LILLVGGAELIIDGIRSVVVAVLTKLARLLTCIQIGQLLGREQKSGRFISGLPAKATIGRCTILKRIGLSNELSEFCDKRSEFVLSHSDCSDFRNPSPDARAFDKHEATQPQFDLRMASTASPLSQQPAQQVNELLNGSGELLDACTNNSKSPRERCGLKSNRTKVTPRRVAKIAPPKGTDSAAILTQERERNRGK
jgi:hypothetical protein